MISKRITVVAVTFGLLSAAGAAGLMTWRTDVSPAQPTSITFQLPWKHSGAFAGYYVADRSGAFGREGLAVRFREGGGTVDPVQSVLDGTAQIGIATANHLIKARAEGKKVRAIAVLHQINPVVFVTLEGSGITHPRQFAGKTIRSSLTNLPILRAITQRFGVTPDQYRVVQTFDYTRIYSGEIQVLTGFHFWTRRRLEKDGQKGYFIYPDNYGIHFYRDSIFTTDEFIAKHPRVIAGFLRTVLLQGWARAIRDPEAAGALVANYNPEADKGFETAFLTAMLPLINTGEVPVGWMKPEVWDEMTRTLRDIGILEKEMDSAEIYTLRFLREIYGAQGPAPASD